MKKFFETMSRVVLDPVAFFLGMIIPGYLFFHLITKHVMGVPFLGGLTGCIIFLMINILVFLIVGPCIGFIMGTVTDSLIQNIFHGIPQVFLRKEKCVLFDFFILNLFVTIVLRYRIGNKSFDTNGENGRHRLIHLFPFWGLCLLKDEKAIAFGGLFTPFNIYESIHRCWYIHTANKSQIVMSMCVEPAHGDWAVNDYFLIQINGSKIIKKYLGKVSYNDCSPNITIADNAIKVDVEYMGRGSMPRARHSYTLFSPS